MEEPQAAGAPRHPLSGDGDWWWNGRRWVPAVSEDLLWRWDGAAWQPTIDLKSKRASDLAATLALMAEERYARAGRILLEQVGDWYPERALSELIERLRQVQHRLGWLQARLHPGRADLGERLLGMFTAPADPERLEEERLALAAEERGLLVRLGRAAPSPSVKDADDTLLVARTLDERASGLTAALNGLDQAERAHAIAVAEAQGGLAAAEDRRRRALQQARHEIEVAAARHAAAVRAALDRLRSALRPAAGDQVATFGPLRLFSAALEAPGGRLPLAGAGAVVGAAGELWDARRELLADLALSGSPGIDAFLDALTERSGDTFLLIWGRSGAAIVEGAGDQEAAARFAALLCDRAAEAARAERARETGARKAEAELRAMAAERPEQNAAEALARLEADPELRRSVDLARERLEEALAEPEALTRVRRRLLELAEQGVSPPPPLVADQSSGGSRGGDQGGAREGRARARQRPVAKPHPGQDPVPGDGSEAP
jgi:hypothetical protein